jgi:hypothetical protein
MSQERTPDIPLPFQLSRMIQSMWVTQVIYAATALEVTDHLASGPKRSEELAAAIQAHPRSLYRLLRALVTLDLCAFTDDGAFVLTPLGSLLRKDSPQSLRSWALLRGGPMMWSMWGRLEDCVRTGETAPKLASGLGFFEYLDAHPAELSHFDQTMIELTKNVAKAVVPSYDFSGIRRLVDVGGGYGELCADVLAAYPEMSGVVLDLPRCREGALRLIEERGLAGRCAFVEGDFFQSVPGGADAYLVKSIIHNWDDEHCIAILRQCHAAMSESSRLLIVDLIVPDRPSASPLDAMIAGTDLNMLVLPGGQERTEAELQALLEAAGLRLTRTVKTPIQVGIVEARVL